MNTCPHCGMNREKSQYANEYDCGSFFDRKNKWYRTKMCEIREPIFQELQAAKTRIEALEKAGDAISKALIGTEGQSHWQWLAEAHEADLLWRKAKEVKP